MRRNVLCLMVAGLFAGNAFAANAAVTPAVPAVTAGDTKDAPIEVCKPQGEQAYLSRLTCENGARPGYRRLGSFGERTPLPDDLSREDFERMFENTMRYEPLTPGEADHHIIDGFELTCGTEKRMVYMDMYHCADIGENGSAHAVSAGSCAGNPGCLDKIARYCARRAEHDKNPYAEVFDRAGLTYFLELVNATFDEGYAVVCDSD